MIWVPGHFVEASGLSDAWLAAATVVAAQPERHMPHLVVRIESPLSEDAGIRYRVDGLLASFRLQGVDSVANTIFPAVWAKDTPDPIDLAADYRDHYPALKKLAGSTRGTYFGRMVAYPRAEGRAADQFNCTIKKLRQSNKPGKQRWTSTYEMSIYNEKMDGHAGLRGFPCMSHFAFHLHGTTLHACAQYRNQDIVERAYGNYVGLAKLQNFVAKAADLVPGALTVFAGHAYIPSGKRQRLHAVLRDCGAGRT